MDNTNSNRWKVLLGLVLVLVIGAGVFAFAPSEGLQGLMKLKKDNIATNEVVRTTKTPPAVSAKIKEVDYFNGECLSPGNTSSTLVFDGVEGGVAEYNNGEDFFNALKAEIKANQNQTKCPYLFKIYSPESSLEDSSGQDFKVVAKDFEMCPNDTCIIFANGDNGDSIDMVILPNDLRLSVRADISTLFGGYIISGSGTGNKFKVYRVAPDYTLNL